MTAGQARPEEAVLSVRIARLEQLFDSLDPSPFRERDLDPRAEAFVVEWAREQRSDVPLALRIELAGDGAPHDASILRQAVAQFFESRAHATRQGLRRLLRNGRISLVIGLAFVAAANVIAAELLSGLGYGIVQDSVVIGGWVALWRPLEIFLYDWWPIRAEARLYDRLAAMDVQIVPVD
jgi:hypothetical protein